MKITGQKRLEFKNKLRKRKAVFAGWTSLGHPSISDIFARSGIDFIGIDIEHSTISYSEASQIISACHGNGILCLPRIASHSSEMIKRLLDSGADGIIAPMVNTDIEAKRLIEWCKYPPLGKRSFGIAKAQGYGFDFNAYVKDWNRSSSLIAQIESIEGVENIEKILALEEIDGVMIGPYDLSGSLNMPGRLNDPKIIKACKKVVDACKRHNKGCGTQVIDPDIDNVKNAFYSGYTFVVLASDIFLLWKWGERMKGIIGEARGIKC